MRGNASAISFPARDDEVALGQLAFGSAPTMMDPKEEYAKLALAVAAHLGQIFGLTIGADNKVRRFVEWDHGQLLLAAASLRALLFDDADRAMLGDVLSRRGDAAMVETLECSASMLTWSVLEPESESHLSDLFHEIYFSESMRSDFKIDVPHRIISMHVGDIPPSMDGLLKKKHLWSANAEGRSVGLSRKDGGPAQYADITRRLVPISVWGDVRIGFLKDVPIRRRTIVCYVANKLGGVHYDSRRIPPDPNDAEEFRALTASFDWNGRALMHAGLMAVAICCVELVRTRSLFDLLMELADFYNARQESLRNEFAATAKRAAHTQTKT